MKKASVTEPISRVEIDLYGPIDYERLKARVEATGPYTLSLPDRSLDVSINIAPCPIENCPCSEDVISLSQTCGFTSLSTMISRAQMAAYDSLAALAEDFLRHPQMLFDPSAEQQYIESEIREHLGVDPQRIYNTGLPEGKIKMEGALSEAIKQDLWCADNLQVILSLLVEHQRMLAAVETVSGQATLRELFPAPESLIDVMHGHYKLGFLTARLISEHFVRDKIEPFARKGVDFTNAQRRRTDGSGKTSSDKRHQRIEAMLTHMERLVSQNPDIRRFGIKKLAELAIVDAIKQDGVLWYQGKHQGDAYLDEMKSDSRYHKRYNILAKKMP